MPPFQPGSASGRHGTGVGRFPGQWRRIELRHLLTLEAIAEEGSFVRAAQQLGYVQSAVSQQLATLESFVGMRLVRRSRGARGAELTVEGHQFLEHARAILGEMRAAAATVDVVEGSYVVRIAADRSVAVSRLVPSLAFESRDGEAQAIFELDEGLDRERVLALVETGEIDAGCLPDTPPVGFNSVELYRDRWVTLSRLVRERESISLDELAAARHVALRGITPTFPRACCLPVPAATAESIDTLVAMVSAGLGLAVVPESLVQGHDDGLSRRGICEPGDDFSRVVYLAWRRKRPIKPALRRLLEQLHQRAAASSAPTALIAAEPAP